MQTMKCSSNRNNARNNRKGASLQEWIVYARRLIGYSRDPVLNEALS